MRTARTLALTLAVVFALICSAASAETWQGFGGTDLARSSLTGTLFSIDFGALKVTYFSETGTGLASFGGPGQTDGTFSTPAGIAVDGNGDVEVVDGGSPTRIEKFSSSGTYLTQWGSTGCGDGQFNAPRAIDTGGSATGPTVYVGDQNCPAP